jgi:hypothetical protein
MADYRTANGEKTMRFLQHGCQAAVSRNGAAQCRAAWSKNERIVFCPQYVTSKATILDSHRPGQYGPRGFGGVGTFLDRP